MKYACPLNLCSTVNTLDIRKTLIFKPFFVWLPFFKMCLFFVAPGIFYVLSGKNGRKSLVVVRVCRVSSILYTVQEVDLGRNKFREFFSKHWFLQSAKFHNYVTYLRDKKCQNFNLEKIVIPTLGLGMRSQNLAAHCCQLKWPERESCHCSADHSS